jgi:hypothetical protein
MKKWYSLWCVVVFCSEHCNSNSVIHIEDASQKALQERLDALTVTGQLTTVREAFLLRPCLL